MESEESEFYTAPSPRIVVVPSVQPAACGCRAAQKQCRCRQCGSPVKSPLRAPAVPTNNCANYLTKGGARAVEKACEARTTRHEAAAWRVSVAERVACHPPHTRRRRPSC
jgi:hypothetical protein